MGDREISMIRSLVRDMPSSMGQQTQALLMASLGKCIKPTPDSQPKKAILAG